MREHNATPFRSAAGATALADLYTQQLAAWPLGYTAQTVATRHGDTHVLLAGDAGAPPLLLFHDWGATAAAMALHYDVDRLAERFRLVVPDIPGQPGRSAAAHPTDYAEWTLDVLDALTLGEVFAAGSGYLALTLAATAPDRVIRAVVIGGGGLAAQNLTTPHLLAAALPLRLRPSRASARRWLRAVGPSALLLTPAHEHLARQIALTAEHAAAFSPPADLTDAELAQIRAPVLLLLGEHDPTLRPQAASRRAESHILNVEQATIDNAGHYVGVDAPGEVEARLLAFFGALG